MKNSGTKYPSGYVKANSVSNSWSEGYHEGFRTGSELAQSFNNKLDGESVDSAIATARSQLRDASEHFVNDEGDDCFAIYEDDAIQIVTDILESLRKDS